MVDKPKYCRDLMGVGQRYKPAMSQGVAGSVQGTVKVANSVQGTVKVADNEIPSFYNEFPFRQTQYFYREKWIDYCDAGAFPPDGTSTQIWEEIVPRNQVMVITSVMYLASTEFVRWADPLAGDSMITLLTHDGFLLRTGEFFFEVSGAVPYDIKNSLISGFAVVDEETSGTSLLNRDIMIAGMRYHVPVFENQVVRFRFIRRGTTDAPITNTLSMAVVFGGLWIPMSEWKRFASIKGA